MAGMSWLSSSRHSVINRQKDYTTEWGHKAKRTSLLFPAIHGIIILFADLEEEDRWP
jgi:hypothetical protein